MNDNQDKLLLEEDTFDELYVRYYPALRAYARLFLKDDWAEDVVQDVFCNVWKNRAQISLDDPLYKYLMRSVYNRAINYLDKHKRDTQYRSWFGMQIEHASCAYYDPDRNPTLLSLYDSDMRTRLREIVDSLPDKRREVFRLRYFENLSNREIAFRLDLTVSTVENHMYLALKYLRDKMR